MFYLGILAAFVGICLFAKGTKAGACFPKKKSFIEQLFFDAAAFLCRWFRRKGKSDTDVENETERIKLFLIIFMAGDIVALLLWRSSDGSSPLVDGSYILRKSAGEGSLELELTARDQSGEEIAVPVIIGECLYETGQLQVLYEEMLSRLETIVLGENTSYDCVTKDLVFVQEVEGYPFFLSWYSDNYRFLSPDGTVATWREVANEQEKEALVTITMRAEYEDFAREWAFMVRVCPQKGEISFAEKVTYAIEKAELDSRKESKIMLPKEVGENTLTWSVKKENPASTVLVLGMVGALAVCLLGNRDLQKEREHHTAQMEAEYSAVISKLTLYLGAGLNLKSAFYKVAGEGSSNPVYEEMQITCREMESGIPQGEAYERLGRRINRKQYIRLATLLAQNLKKGNAELLTQLKQEAYLALEEKNMAIRKLGEETGTKLLLPMMLMLAMVMVLIMVPAFLTI